MTKQTRTREGTNELDEEINQLKVGITLEGKKVEALRCAFMEVLTHPEVIRLLDKYKPFTYKLFKTPGKVTSTYYIGRLSELSETIGWERRELQEVLQRGVNRKEPAIVALHHVNNYDTSISPVVISPTLLRKKDSEIESELVKLANRYIQYTNHNFEETSSGRPQGVYLWDGKESKSLNPKEFKNHIVNHFIKPCLEIERRRIKED